MTQPQPPQPHQPQTGPASTIPDSDDKHQLLRQLLYDVPLPKTPKATNCVFLLENLLKARSLIDLILDNNNNNRQPTPLESLCTKLDDLAAQVAELKESHAHTQTGPPFVTHDTTTTPITTPTTPRQSYAAATATKTPIDNARSTSFVREPSQPATPQPPQTLPIRNQNPKRVIMRFTSDCPAVSERMTPRNLRDAVNEVLLPARIQISGAEFTRAGHIALTPHTPCTTHQLLHHSDAFGPVIAHGRLMEEIVFEHDKAWYSVVIGGIQLRSPKCKSEEWIWDEMLLWNETLHSGVKAVRLLCHPEELLEREKGSLLVSFEEKEDYEKVLRDGVFAYGKRYKSAPYRPRRNFSNPPLSPRPILDCTSDD
jgi:hypothetical protein